MSSSRNYTMPYRRKREAKTDYKKRLKLLVSHKPRVVVRRTVKGMQVQVVSYKDDGDVVLAAAHSSELHKHGLAVVNGNIPVAYLTGVLLASKAKKVKEEVIVDFGLQKLTGESRLYAVVKGLVDGGMNVKVSEDILPSDERVAGTHIENYAKAIKEDKARYEKQFSEYIKQKIDPTSIATVYEKVKQALLK